jgi:serine/threonine protein kinase
VFGRYRLGEVIGACAMGTICRAHDSVIGRQVAIKVLAAEFGASSGRNTPSNLWTQRVSARPAPRNQGRCPVRRAMASARARRTVDQDRADWIHWSMSSRVQRRCRLLSLR